MPRKTKTLDQIRAMQDKAVRFLRDAVRDPDKADEFEAMTPEEYAEHKRITIKNPLPRGIPSEQRRLHHMARLSTYSKLRDRVAELEEENQALNDKLSIRSSISHPAMTTMTTNKGRTTTKTMKADRTTAPGNPSPTVLKT